MKREDREAVRRALDWTLPPAPTRILEYWCSGCGHRGGPDQDGVIRHHCIRPAHRTHVFFDVTLSTLRGRETHE